MQTKPCPHNPLNFHYFDNDFDYHSDYELSEEIIVGLKCLTEIYGFELVNKCNSNHQSNTILKYNKETGCTLDDIIITNSGKDFVVIDGCLTELIKRLQDNNEMYNIIPGTVESSRKYFEFNTIYDICRTQRARQLC